MTKDEVARIVEGMPQGMDIDDYLVELVNRAIFLDRQSRITSEKAEVEDWNGYLEKTEGDKK